MWPEFLHKYFGFNKQQGRGLFVLALVCLSLFIIRLLLPFFEPEREIIIQNLPLIKVEAYPTDSIPSNDEEKREALRSFPFDPNIVSFEQLIELGFKPSSAKALVKFREKGFVFKSKEDLLKVYGVEKTLFNRLKNFILLPEIPEHQINSQESKSEPQIATTRKERHIRVELNSADSLTLLGIPGIGPSFSKRILKYRALLGGYYKVNQLMEVYGFTEKMLQDISPYVFVNSSLIQKININRSEFKALNRHPYLSYEQTKSIVKARNKQMLDSISLKELLGDEALYQQLRPYCAFD